MRTFFLSLSFLFLPFLSVAYEYDNELNDGITTEYVVTLVGDSFTHGGIDDPDMPSNLGIWNPARLCWNDLCFAKLLQVMLDEDANADLLPPIQIENRGMSGASSRDWDPNDYRTDDYQYQHNLMGANRPLFSNIPVSDAVFYLIGVNDSVGYLEPGPISPEEYERYLYDFMFTLLRRGVKNVVLVSPPLVRYFSEETHDRLRAYAEAGESVCRRLGRHLDDCFLDLQRVYPEYGFTDTQTHPTFAGHVFIAEQYRNHIKRLVLHNRSHFSVRRVIRHWLKHYLHY